MTTRPVGAPTRRERRAIETRRAIIDTARRLFEVDGFAATTVERIAEQADVAPRTFFRYFPTKESLLFADFDEVRARMLDTLESRPSDEDPLHSLSVALTWMARAIDERSDELVWGFRLCAEQEVEGVYERVMIKEHTNDRVAAFLAGRLGVDPETDPRPTTWATAVMAVFGAAMKFSATERPGSAGGDPVAMFAELLDTAADGLRAARPMP